MSEDATPPAAGWYPVPREAGSRTWVGYWDGTAWTGAQRRAGMNGNQPRDLPGAVAIILLAAGFACTIFVPFVVSWIDDAANLPTIVLTVTTLIVLAATPVAIVVSIAGLVLGHQSRFKTPASLVALILSILGTVCLALPIALFVTGVWVLPHF